MFRPLLQTVAISIVVTSFDVAVLAAPQQSSQVASDVQLDFFESRIRPVLVEHCYSCHSAEAKNLRGGLLLDSAAGLLTGGDSGAALVVGKADESLILSALKHESFEMPPDRRLPDDVIKDFETWINNGAADPRVGTAYATKRVIDLDKGREFWAFRPVVRPDVPAAGEGWALSDVDRIVAAKHGDLAVAGDATPEAILRRLSFVLTGLAPSLEQQRTFLAAWQKSPEDAMAATVDALMASQHFGERWGRHWLDVVRFAESTGGGRSMMMPDAWRFRDYVIRSFNDDKPLPQLIREHIAGDLLPSSSDAQHDEQLVGVGYLALGANNYEEQDKEQLRMDVVDEQIDSTGRTFLGMTLGCARCHDHKFDPIPTADYYAMAGVFRSTTALVPGNVSGFVTTPLRTGFDKPAVDAWTARDKELENAIAALKKSAGQAAPRTNAVAAAKLAGVIVDDSDAVLDGIWTASKYQQPFIGDGYHHSGMPRTGMSARYEAQLPDEGEYFVRMVINHGDSRSDKVPVLIAHADGESIVVVNQKQKPPGDGVFLELGRFRFERDRPAVVVVNAADASPSHVIVDAFQFLSVSQSAAAPSVIAAAPAEASAVDSSKVKLKQLEADRKQHAKTKPVVPLAMCVKDDAKPADWHVHVRGEIRNLGAIVPRGVLAVSLPNGESPAFDPAALGSSSGRRELADWIASPTNPLTARVYVNRIWKNVMGEGIVRTPDNFGETGDRPTHPELLDFLADTFVHDDAWSTKALIRRLCLSRTFRMSSSAAADLGERDPDNLLLTHAFRRRLEAECVRDAVLQVSGSLDLHLNSGRTIGQLAEYDNDYDHSKYPLTCRSIYVPAFRNTMLDVFEVFDGANPNLVTGQRTRSTRPAQALYMLNSPFVIEQSSAAARTFAASPEFDADNVQAMVDRAWQLCLCRLPEPAERDALLPIVAEQPTSIEAWSTVFHAIMASVEFRFLD